MEILSLNWFQFLLCVTEIDQKTEIEQCILRTTTTTTTEKLKHKSKNKTSENRHMFKHSFNTTHVSHIYSFSFTCMHIGQDIVTLIHVYKPSHGHTKHRHLMRVQPDQILSLDIFGNCNVWNYLKLQYKYTYAHTHTHKYTRMKENSGEWHFKERNENLNIL